MNETGKRDNSRRLPTVMAAAIALLASTTGTNASSEQNTIPPVANAKRQNEDEATPTLILVPPDHLNTLIAGHSSHASHSSHYSSSTDPDPYPSPSPYTPPPVYTSPPAPTYSPPVTPPAEPPPPSTPPPTPFLSDESVLDKLAQLPDFWPRKIKLKQAFSFPLIHEGMPPGHLDVPAGTSVDLVKVKGSTLVISFVGNKADVPASITDIDDHINAVAIMSAPIPVSPSSTNGAPTAPTAAPATASP